MLWQVLNVIHGYSLNPILRFFKEKYYHIDMSIFASEKKSKDKQNPEIKLWAQKAKRDLTNLVCFHLPTCRWSHTHNHSGEK